jgi:hypothetical protein
MENDYKNQIRELLLSLYKFDKSSMEEDLKKIFDEVSINSYRTSNDYYNNLYENLKDYILSLSSNSFKLPRDDVLFLLESLIETLKNNNSYLKEDEKINVIQNNNEESFSVDLSKFKEEFYSYLLSNKDLLNVPLSNDDILSIVINFLNTKKPEDFKDKNKLLDGFNDYLNSMEEIYSSKIKHDQVTSELKKLYNSGSSSASPLGSLNNLSLGRFVKTSEIQKAVSPIEDSLGLRRGIILQKFPKF